MASGLVVWQIVALGALGSGCAGPTEVADVLDRAGDVERGRTVWDVQCASCHAPDGSGTADGVDLTDRPLTELQVVQRVVEGWGSMEGFADRLSPGRTADVVAFALAEVVPAEER